VASVTNQGPAAVRKALDAANSGDTDRFLDCFGDTGALDVTTTGDTTVVTAQVGGSGFNGPSHFAFTVQGDLIAVMRITA
jgi:hypothetical protein